ncbi:dynein regulatory complex subunit 4-like [Bacillus rossius redtenbacheri]|uniref:dynein regulatory complex subunit 4-like n=1 Tax=Bacillus rossius redtenbacheri TaxID=93214 RepID=UPI002FDE801C
MAAHKKKKKGKPEEDFLIDGVSTIEMTRPQLRVLANRLHEELLKEKEDRNLMQLERDKLHTFHDVCRQQLAECQAGLSVMKNENEDAEEKHQVELKQVEQKVKYLMHEHETLLNEAVEFAEEIEEAREVFLEEKNELKKKAEKRLLEASEELTLKFRMELSELEIRKNKQIDDLVKEHDSAFASMKYYFNDIMDNNLSLIKGLKEKLRDVQKKLEDASMLEKECKRRLAFGGGREAAVGRRRRRSSSSPGPPPRAQEEEAAVRQAGDQSSCDAARAALELREEGERLRRCHREALQELLQEADLRAALRETRVQELRALLEAERARAVELAAGGGGAAFPRHLRGLVQERLAALLAGNNALVQELLKELARACKAHDELLRACEAKLRQLGVPPQELGFEPRRADVARLRLGRGPAGLAALNT